eukprot:TRINITY_DN2775_c3_g1_i1.p1 TRINITY_DN2775_c3_g1~~TRINITY_DN2775_c3_g1_i1.p1  ORF type:complete len:468 (-),score=97.63 TRINITY_DN2775_c3_g1_i1:28-1431(-)
MWESLANIKTTPGCRWGVRFNGGNNKMLVRNYHTSLVVLGRKNRKASKKKFFTPREWFWQHQSAMWRNEMSNSQDHLGIIADSLFFPNYPQGDIFPLKSNEEIETTTDRLEEIYYMAYPTEKHAILHRFRPADKEWYKTPFQRFSETYEIGLAQGLTPKNAILFAEKEKQWEEEAIELEREVCRAQAQEMFSILKTDPDTREGNPIEAKYLNDPRIVEYEQKLLRDKLDNLVNQRIRNPRLPKITVKKAGVTAQQIIEYISRNSGINTPSFAKTGDNDAMGVSAHFDESVYFGDYLKHSEEMIKQLQAEQLSGEAEEKEAILNPGGHLLDDDEDTGKPYTIEDMERDFSLEPRPMNPNRPLPGTAEYVDQGIKSWAQDLMGLLSDRIDIPGKTAEEDYSRKTMATLGRIVGRHQLKQFAGEQIGNMDPEDLINASMSTKDILRQHTNQPISPHLAEELHSLFSNLKK